MRAFVYWNVHKKLFSIRVGGKVIAHAERLIMDDVTFKVSEAGRQRVLATGRKNVHAGIEGDIVACCKEGGRYLKAMELPSWNGVHGEHAAVIRAGGQEVSYNPRKGPHFCVVGSGKALKGGGKVSLHGNPFTMKPTVYVDKGTEIFLDQGGNT